MIIEIANGGVKEKKKDWYTFGIPVNHFYTLDDQLSAIKRLGSSANHTAHDFLRRLNETRKRWGEVMYPNTKGSLREILHVDAVGQTGTIFTGVACVNPRIRESLQTLEESLKTPSFR